MASLDSFFKVKTGLGVGTDTLYASAVDKNVAIGKTSANPLYKLDVIGSIYSDENVIVDNNVGVGTTNPTQSLDVRGKGVFSERVGIGTTNPVQVFQVNNGDQSVVVTGVGSFGIGTLNPGQDFQFVGNNATNSVVITGIASIGIRTTNPIHDFQLLTSGNQRNFVITRQGLVGINKDSPEYDLDVLGDARISGFATITTAYIGVATIGFASIGYELVGMSTVGFSSITNANVGFATINNELVGISTIGFASISNAYVGFASISSELVGISTIGFATITNAYVGFATIRNELVGVSTIGFASITNEFVGFSTIGFATITNAYVGFGTIGIATIGREKVVVSEIEELLVTGITTTAKLDVGIGATLVRARGFGITTVFDLENNVVKEINPIVGIATTLPTRTLDVAGDIRVRGEIVDSNNQVGYAYSVLASSGANGISGRFFDAANLLVRNKEFIANEIVGFITSTDGPFGPDGPNFDYGVAGIQTGPSKCKRDIGLIIDAITFDITKGGNSKSVGAGLSYYSGVTLQYLDDSPSPPPGFSAGYVKQATLVGFSSIATLAQYVINNVPLKTSYQSGIGSIKQLFDTELISDGDSNTNPNGCANVVSAIYSCVGIITTIVNNGPSAAPKVNDPSGKLVWNPPGARIGNEWFVNKYGSDSNGGTGPGDAFITIKKACSVAEPGDTIRIYAGLYVEDGPIQVPERVAIVGEDLRRTLVTTRDQTDLYHVRRGCYIAQQSFVGPSNPGKAMVSFPTQGNGYANGTEQDWQSPYIQNCTNFVPNSIGMRVDGNRAGGFKSMVLDAYTQYNQGGIGVSITNFGYAQLVSLFTICCDTAVFCDTGGVCDLNNSNSSFGNYGLVSNGATPLQYTGTIVTAPTGDNVDSLVINVGAGASQQYIDTVELLRLNKKFIAAEAVGFLTSTDGPYGANGPNFNYGGSKVGRSKCIRDGQIIVESLCSDILTLGNGNSINAGLAYRDSADGSLTYLNETSPAPVGFSSGYVKQGEVAIVNYIAGICTYVAQNQNLPISYQSGIGSITQIKDLSKTYSATVQPFISNRSSIITSIIGIGTTAAPELILSKGQRPYDGQIAYIDTQYYFVSRIDIDNPGSGYDPNIPVEVVIGLPINTDYFIAAEAAVFETDINQNGSISNVSLLVSGTGYSSTPPTVTIAPPPGAGTQATAHAVMEKLFFNPISSTPVSVGGTTTVTFDEFITYPVSVGSTVYFYQSSKIIASSITFEYIGTGINIVNAIPSKGAVPINDNQVVATNGGKVPFTSTDQGGNFRISEGITINQNTGTITGQAFSKSLQAEVTPLIIALQQ